MLFERTFKRGNYEYGYLQGDLWLKVFYHSYQNKALFSGPDEAKYTISKDKFSIFANLTDDFKIDNKFEFIIYYPENNVYFRWVQNKNPNDELETSDRKAPGFEDRGSTVDGFRWGGLVKTTIEESYQINAFLNGNPGYISRYFGIGMYDIVNDYWKNLGIPSYYDGGSVNFVSIWIRLPFPIHIFHLCSIRSIFSIDFPLTFFTSIILRS